MIREFIGRRLIRMALFLIELSFYLNGEHTRDLEREEIERYKNKRSGH